TELTRGAELTVAEGERGTVVGGRLPAGGVAAVLATEAPVPVSPAGEPSTDVSFPLRPAVRVAAPPSASRRRPAGAVPVEAGRHELTVRFRVRETGLYGEAPYVDEWKPLPP